MKMGTRGMYAVMTGGGMGIERAIALALAQEGPNISIVDMNSDPANETVEQIEKFGCRGFVCKTDVSKALAIDLRVEKILEEFSRIDTLTSEAGVSHPAISSFDLHLE